MNMGSKRPIGWNFSRNARLWRFYWHGWIEKTRSRGSTCIVCHQVLRHPSEDGTSSIGKHMEAQVHMAKLNESRESEVTKLTGSIINGTALAILKRWGSRGITIVSSQSKFMFDIWILFILTKVTDKIRQTSSEELSNCRVSRRHLESLPDVSRCLGSYSMERCQTCSYEHHIMHYDAIWCYHPPAHWATFAEGNTHRQWI